MGRFQHGVPLAVVGYRMILVSTGWTTSYLVSTNGGRNHSSPLLGTPFLVLKAVFSQEQRSLVRVLAIESSLMSGCGQGHEPPKNDSEKLWLKLPVLAPSRVKIRTKEGIHSLKRLVVNGL